MKKLALFLLNLVSAISFLIAVLLIKLRLRRESDPWRRTVGIGLRSEASKFGLSAFGIHALSPWADERFSEGEEEQRIGERFAGFLQTEPFAHFALRHDRFCSYRVASPQVDVTMARFFPWGELRSISPIFDTRYPIIINEFERREIELSIVDEYNRTRQLPEFARPRALIHGVNKGLLRARKLGSARSRAYAYGQRILNSCCVSFEVARIDAFQRFQPPDFRARRVVGAGFLNIVCRRAPGGTTDIWMQVHHTGGDGLPMQELLMRLETAWGTMAGVFFPNDTGTQPKPVPCHAGTKERRLYILTDFVDFSPLVRLRNDLKNRFAKDGIEAIPLGALFLWCLAHQPEFEGVKFASAIDVPADKTSARSVDLVPIRPGDYMHEGGFLTYLRDFNRLILDARQARTKSYQAMRNLALLPPVLASAALRLNPGVARSTFGTVGVSIVKDAKVVVGTMADRSFDGGFILIGNMSLPCAGGRTSTSVSIKGELAAIRNYPTAIRRAIRSAPHLDFPWKSPDVCFQGGTASVYRC
jgi:hypothetical protein